MIKEIQLKGKQYKVLFKKSKRAKYMQLKIYRTGEINLIVPFKYNYKDANNFLEREKKWVEKKISKLAFNMNKFRYLGCELKLSINTEKKDKLFYLCAEEGELILPEDENLSVETLFNKWLFDKANEFIPKRVDELANKHGFSFNNVKVKSLKSRWGSCSSKKNLSFNYKLMSFDANIIDYVIIHELCHLKQMNHSIKFWKLVKEITPQYKIYKQQLLQN